LHLDVPIQLSKESRQALHSASDQDWAKSTTKDYTQLDKTSQAADEYLQRKEEELDSNLRDLVSSQY
jgi:hypothetical protein